MKRYLIAAFMTITLCAAVSAQYATSPIFTTGDDISLHIDDGGGHYYTHEVKKGQTLYALSRAFGYRVEELKAYNGKSSAIVSLGEKVNIPIDVDALFRGSSVRGLKYGTYIPAVYVAKPKDNLYRISKVLFAQSLAEVMERNQLATADISIGDRIIIGWYPLEQELDEYVNEEPTLEAIPTATEILNDTVATALITNESVDSIVAMLIPEDFNVALLGTAPYSEHMTLVDTKEVAHWDKNVPDNGEIYVLHNTAVVDSYMELYNPLVKRSVRAKVIGKIPFGAYTPDVKLLISPKAAAALGALDARFRVEVKYYR